MNLRATAWGLRPCSGHSWAEGAADQGAAVYFTLQESSRRKKDCDFSNGVRFSCAMKTTIKSIAMAATALLFTTQITSAQDKPADKPGDKPEGRRRGFGSPEDRLKAMTERLGLSQEQQDKIKAIYAKDADTMKALREKGRENLTDDDRKKMGDLFKAQMESIQAVLTDEQKAKMKEGFGGRRPGGPDGDKKPEGEKKPDATK